MGDPACWADRVCPVCGAFVEEADEATHVHRGDEVEAGGG